jgi:hypothetical protein
MPTVVHPTSLPGFLVFLGACGAGMMNAQVTPPPPTPALVVSSVPLRLDLSRRDLRNFLNDKEALAPYQLADGSVADLHDVFAIGSVSARWAVFWDARSCRLLGILDLEAPPESPLPAGTGREEKTASAAVETHKGPVVPSPYLFKATGPFPLAKSVGASGDPRYFGFRLVKNVPEFLYTSGSLSIEERLWLDDGGKVLRQRFAARDASGGMLISVPEDWQGRVTASVGTWKGAVLAVPKESAAEVILSYPLPAASRAAEPSTPETN